MNIRSDNRENWSILQDADKELCRQSDKINFFDFCTNTKVYFKNQKSNFVQTIREKIQKVVNFAVTYVFELQRSEEHFGAGEEEFPWK